MAEIRRRNMVERLDGRMVNSGQLRGMLFVCATGCCCGRTERGFAEVDETLYHAEWERRGLRNRVHLNQGGCLGPCVLANVVMLVVDGRPFWFHSVNDRAIVGAMFDYIERLLEEIGTPPPPVLQPHVFNGFAWDGAPGSGAEAVLQDAAETSGDGVVFLSQSDTDLLALERARVLLPEGFAGVEAAHVGRLADEGAVDALLQRLLPGAQVVGICGGYQIAGEWLADPLGMEGEPGGQAAGLGLLPVKTEFLARKETHQARMRLDDGEEVRGYEIHTGDSRVREGTAWFGEIIERSGRPVRVPDGASAEDGSLWGSYLHGLFENDDFRHRWLRGLGWSGPVVATTALREREYNRLADVVEEAVDWTAVEALIA